MREISFRGRKTDSNSWAVGSLIIASDYCCILESEDDVHPMDYPYLDNYIGTIDGKATPVIPETVGQYTGLTDKNGKKIFEGDIVKIEHNDYVIDGMTLEYRKEKGVIAYDNIGSVGLIVDRCKYKNVWSDFFNVLGLTDRIESWSFEIIGNIHDNPELLNL